MGTVYYVGLIVWSTFECILVSAICFGWPQLLEVLEKERYFASYCENDNDSTLSTVNQTLNGQTCSQQDSILNLIYSFSTFATATAVFAGGKFLDVYGFRKTRLLSSVIYMMAGILMYLSTHDIPELLIPGMILTSSGGACFLSCLVKVCGTIPSRRYTAVSVINGAIDSSAVILLLFKLSYTAGISFENIIIIYFTFAVGHSVLFTFTLFPKKIPDYESNKNEGKIERFRENGTNIHFKDVDPEEPNQCKTERFNENGTNIHFQDVGEEELNECKIEHFRENERNVHFQDVDPEEPNKCKIERFHENETNIHFQDVGEKKLNECKAEHFHENGRNTHFQDVDHEEPNDYKIECLHENGRTIHLQDAGEEERNECKTERFHVNGRNVHFKDVGEVGPDEYKIECLRENERSIHFQDVSDEEPNETKSPEKPVSLNKTETLADEGEIQVENRSSVHSNDEKFHEKMSCSSTTKITNIQDTSTLANESDLHQDKETFLSIIKTPKYIIHTCFLSVHVLRLLTFVGMLNLNLKRLSNDTDEVEFYLTMFGIIQFGGILFSFLPGFLLDWRPKGRHDSFSVILSFVFTGFISIFLTIGVLIPSLNLQVLCFLLHTLLRSFVYSCHGSFIIKEFPLRHSGALYGLSTFISALVSLLQFPLFILIEGPCSGDPTWVNLGLLVIQIIMFKHPIYLRSLTKKESAEKYNEQYRT